MYTREQASIIKQQFWTRFGKYMAPILSADGEKINWMNYKTGIRHINFRMNATQGSAYIGIEINHKDDVQAAALYKQFRKCEQMLEDTLQEKWQWQAVYENEHHQILSTISLTHPGCNVLKEADWPAIISFLKPRILKLDEFWCEHKMIFEMIG